MTLKKKDITALIKFLKNKRTQQELSTFSFAKLYYTSKYNAYKKAGLIK